jgi:hypothetical protein
MTFGETETVIVEHPLHSVTGQGYLSVLDVACTANWQHPPTKRDAERMPGMIQVGYKSETYASRGNYQP